MSDRTRLGRSVAALGLLSVVAGGATIATSTVGASGGAARIQDGITPVLSARRTPGLLRSLVAGNALQRDVNEVLGAANLGSARDRSCFVAHAQGRTITAERADEAVIPASTLKLLTASAALSTLSNDRTFRTVVRATAAPTGGAVAGDLWLVGGGDPLLESEAYTATRKHEPGTATSLDALADRVVAAGVRSVSGRIVGDARLFDNVTLIPTWKRSYVSGGEVGPIGGLIVDDNFSIVDEKGRRSAASDIGADGAAAFQRLLEARGVTFGADAANASPGGPSADSAAPAEIAAVNSIPLSGVVAEMLRESDNMTAEVLIKHVGLAAESAGSTAAGVAGVRRYLQLSGVAGNELSPLRMIDGSGLDRGNRVSCRILLDAVIGAPSDGALIGGLAVMGRSGTLRERLRNSDAAGRVRAKTGTLNGVSGLVGTADASEGLRVEFAMILNELPPDASGVAVGDRLAKILVAYPKAPPVEAFAPTVPSTKPPVQP